MLLSNGKHTAAAEHGNEKTNSKMIMFILQARERETSKDIADGQTVMIIINCVADLRLRW